ncbi:MAG: hypothetical protein ACRDMJ_19235 [Solirubrobacteraceae bacterium]
MQQIERALEAPVRAVSRVSVAAAPKGRRSQASVAALANDGRILASALAQIDGQDRRLRALPTPVSAARLRSLLLDLTSGEAELTRQLQLLLAFGPRFSSTLAPLGPQLRRLESALAANQARGAAAVAASYRSKAAALRSFQAGVGAIVVGLRGLNPPQESRPQYLAELASLRKMARVAGRLASALERSNPGDLRPLLIDFDRAALAARSLRAQRAEIAAIRSYDARVQRLTLLRGQIAQEQVSLGRRLG